MNSIEKTARTAGALYLGIAILAIFANFSVLEALVVSGDAVATTHNLMTHEALFRAGIASFVIVLILDVLVAWLLYVLLTPVSKQISMLAAWLRVIYATLLGSAIANFFNVLYLLNGANALEVQQVQAQIMLHLNAFNTTWQIGLVLFGLHLIVLGYLVFKSGYIPQLIGVLLMVGGFAYCIDTFAHVLLLNYAAYAALFLPIVAIPSMIAELGLTFWLLIKGVSVQSQDNRLFASA